MQFCCCSGSNAAVLFIPCEVGVSKNTDTGRVTWLTFLPCCVLSWCVWALFRFCLAIWEEDVCYIQHVTITLVQILIWLGLLLKTCYLTFSSFILFVREFKGCWVIVVIVRITQKLLDWFPWNCGGMVHVTGERQWNYAANPGIVFRPLLQMRTWNGICIGTKNNSNC